VTNVSSSTQYICSVTVAEQNFTETSSLSGQFPVALPSTSGQNSFTINLKFFPTSTSLIYGALSVGYQSSMPNCVSSVNNYVYATMQGKGATNTSTALLLGVPNVLPTATDALAATSFSYSAQLTAFLNGTQDQGVTWSITSQNTPHFTVPLTIGGSTGTLTGTTPGNVSCGFPPYCIFNDTVAVKAVDNATQKQATGTFVVPVYAVDTGQIGYIKECNHISWNVPNSSAPIIPLTDLGTVKYLGQSGGLYDNGNTDMTYQAIGHGFAVNNIDKSNAYIFVALGFSNPNLEFDKFATIATPTLTPGTNLSLVDAAEGSESACCMSGRCSNGCLNYWSKPGGYVDNKLQQNEDEVATVWLKVTNISDTSAFPLDATNLQCDIETIITGVVPAVPSICPNTFTPAFPGLKTFFHNLQLVYVTSRSYAGYAGDSLNPEPYSYETGFGDKFAVHDFVSTVETTMQPPWVGWGPYLWTNGLLPRSDGLTWTCQDVKPGDGRHPDDPTGKLKAAVMLLNFFKNDPTAMPWFK